MQSRTISSLVNSSTGNAASRSSTSLVTRDVLLLADQSNKAVDSHLLDFLTAEVIRIIIASEAHARARRAEYTALVQQDALNLPPTPSIQQGPPLSGALEQDTRAGGSRGQPVLSAVEQEAADAGVRKRLETMGFKVGWAMAERLARDRPRFPTAATAPAAPAPSSAPGAPPTPATSTAATVPTLDTLEVVKFICKDLWIALYDKQIDNLRTNRRGVYVLHDNGFKPIARLSGASGDYEEASRLVRFFLAFPSGIIRGGLANLGISSTVTAESAAIPQSTFQINITKP